jgi:membrane-associated phospholipid phosphatase
LVLFVAPLLLAIIIAASKVRDAWHHAFDVVAGCWIGWLFALGAYKTMFKKKSGVEGRPLGEKNGVGKELEPEEKERLNKQKAV